MTDWYEKLHTAAENAASADFPIEEALQAVCDGYSSIECDRIVAEDDGPADEPRPLEPRVATFHATLKPDADPADQVGQTLALPGDGGPTTYRITAVLADPDGCGYPGCVQLTAVEVDAAGD